MNDKLYIDVNIIQTVPPSCINRDDTGSPKTAIYGGIRRARVSSQSWKKAVRDEFKKSFDEADLAVRTKKIVELVANRIIEIDPSKSMDEAVKMTVDILEAAKVKTKVGKTKAGESELNKIPEAQALFFMSAKQADNLARMAIEGGYDKKSVTEALNKGNGVEIALFGRMVADNPELNCDASCQVAHGISTHKVDNEYDYYTAVDDRAPEDNAGAGMIGTIEYNSSTLYRYATVAVHELNKQLEDADATAKAICEFVRAFTLAMPTGKQNTFANRTIPYMVYIAVRDDQPVNLVAAFEKPVLPDNNGGGYNQRSAERMLGYEKDIESEFVSAPVKEFIIGGPTDQNERTDLQSALDALSTEITSRL